MASDDNSESKSRTSSRKPNIQMNYDETQDLTLSNSSEVVDDTSWKNSLPKKLTKSEKVASEYLDIKPSKDETINNGQKLFPIFSSSPTLRPQNNSHLNISLNGQKDAKDPSIKFIKTSNEGPSIDAPEMLGVNDSCSEDKVTPQSKKRNKSHAKSYSAQVSEEQAVEILSTEAATDTINCNNDEKVLKSSKRKRGTSIKTSDTCVNTDMSCNEPSSSKVVSVKKTSIADFFQKIPSTPDRSANLKLFPIFNTSLPNKTPSPEVNQVPQKRRKINKQLVEESVKQVNASSVDKRSEIVPEDDATSDDLTSEITTPVKKVRKVSQKGRTKSVGAALLRSCSSKSATSGEDLESPSIDNGHRAEKQEIEKKKKIKESSNSVKLTITSTDKPSKVFPMFAKSPAALAKKKSIGLVNSLAKKRAEALFDTEQKKSAIPNRTKVVRKRGRPRKEQPSILLDSTEAEDLMVKEIEFGSKDKLEHLDKIESKRSSPKKEQHLASKDSTEAKEVIDLPVNEKKVSKPPKFKKKIGRPKKILSSSSSEDKEPQLDSMDSTEAEEKLDKLVNEKEVFEPLKVKKKVGRPKKVSSSSFSEDKKEPHLASVKSTEAEKMPDLPGNENEASKPLDKIKKRVGRPRKVLSSSLSEAKTSEEFPKTHKIEIEDDNVFIPNTASEKHKKAKRPRIEQDFQGSTGIKDDVETSEIKSIPNDVTEVFKTGEEKNTDDSAEVKILQKEETGEMESTSKDRAVVSESFKPKTKSSKKVKKAISSGKEIPMVEELPSKLVEIDVISNVLPEGTERVTRKSLRTRTLHNSDSSRMCLSYNEMLDDSSNDSIKSEKKKKDKILKGKRVTPSKVNEKGQPLTKKQKSVLANKNVKESTSKSSYQLKLNGNKLSETNTPTNQPKSNCEAPKKLASIFTSKVKKSAGTKVVELSDDSIEEVITETLPGKISPPTTEVKPNKAKSEDNSDPVNNVKKVYVPVKKPEEKFAFPLYSHCCQIKASETIADDEKDLDIKQTSDSAISIPVWNSIVGLTDVKTIQTPIQTDKVEVPTTDTLSSVQDDATLWTNIANDYNLKEGVTESTISELTTWLQQWKSKFNKNTRHKDKDNSSDSFSCDSNDSEGDGLSNSVILMGPPSSGKTSLVFSLANDHDFKVLEVNASSCRSGRNISHQLKEALESYHVENIKSTDANVLKEKEENSIKSKSRVHNNDSVKKPTNKGIASFFQNEKTQHTDVKDESGTQSVKNFFQASAKSKSASKSKKIDDDKSQPQALNVEVHKESSLCSISSQTIILFDDVDVVFQEDDGFWSTIRSFLKISKKPVIFTVSRNLEIVKANLDEGIQTLYLKPMVNEIAIKKIQEQFQSHNRENTNINMNLLIANCNDVRRNLLHSQFWSQQSNNQKNKINETQLNPNTFYLGSSHSSVVDLISFISDHPSSIACKLISDFHKIGYDIVHANIFSMFDASHDRETERKWPSVTKRQESGDSNSNAKTDSNDEDLWKEACKIFEFKKKALRNGSSSKDLFSFSNILEDFSFMDTLKGPYCEDTKWISLPARLRKWTSGLPMCNDDKLSCPNDLTLDASSEIQVLRMKEALKFHSKQNKPVQDRTIPVILEHPFPTYDNISGHKTEEHIEVVASAASPSLLLNKSVLNLDYLSALKIMGHDELLRQSKTGKRSNRFLHYFDSISLFLDKHQIEHILQV
ncbi:hypothetical protein JTE90_028119 [Oedothorax gibbosus]|uniref:ATPase AAA-type core domain-containing protein n=1 Tax=Oedothorax gibbosus TaxID=931172 RepID=A0AAV6VAJ9_9ARAC|nr:hypothetical protein JTE90_028119 [Oedothorax gibbosus]